MKKQTGMMEIAFREGVIFADAKTGVIKLNDILELGNKIRARKGLPIRDLREFWKNTDTKEFIKALYESIERSDLIQGGNPHHLKPVDNIEVVDYKAELTCVKTGKYGGTWSGLLLALKLATWLDKDLEVEVYQTFINNKILDFRSLGINYNKKLNDTLDSLEDRTGKENGGIYINTSKMIKTKIFGEHHKGWDNEEDDAEAQKKRSEIIDRLVGAIEMKYVRTWEDVKEFFNKI